MSLKDPKSRNVDIVLLLEGTYPYVKGGVSTWVDYIIKAYPDINFGAVFLGSQPSDYEGRCYDFPANLKHFEEHFLFDYSEHHTKVKSRGIRKPVLDHMRDLHHWFRHPDSVELKNDIKNIATYLDPQKGVDQYQFLFSEESWQYTQEMYNEKCPDASFIDYFWTVRNMHIPIWKLAEIVSGIPKAHAYHTVSTGYAGFLGSLLAQFHNVPLILSEHGIYTRERRIDLLKNQLFFGDKKSLSQATESSKYYHSLLIRFFEALGNICYSTTETIVALFEDAKLRQIEDGAQKDKIQVIGNGINIDKFKSARRTYQDKVPPKIALIGRVVPIKDIKTFIRATRIIANKIPDFEALVVGPVDEDLDYAQECNNLANSLELNNHLKFLGTQKTAEILKKVSLTVLSSISEGLPLTILESYAAGLPVVSTDVGSCAQLVYGGSDNDRKLGASGTIVNIASPQALARAIIELLENPEKWQQASNAAIARVEKYYDAQIMYDKYRDIYQGAMS
ncbi:MAG: glycosyl transferase family 1 [Legionellales bacterium]|nr:glycosyl transferase family 1 [Legionellales bacterium]|tara:strand:+ start:9756 stop:11273 length:1518 start_codon:yes stop_codon:yes gene_type:complete